MLISIFCFISVNQVQILSPEIQSLPSIIQCSVVYKRLRMFYSNLMISEKLVHSMVVAFDGESKCGKTTFTEMVAEEARFQARFYRGDELGDDWDPGVRQSIKDGVADWANAINFNNVDTISAGNAFRAAAYYALRQEANGQVVTSFAERDIDSIREILDEDGIIDVLQNDSEIGRRVSSTAKLMGAQALCGAIFCDFISEAYHRDGGSNLVVIDARDPIGHMRRNDMLGTGAGQILPASVLPIYIDTPAEVAASRMAGEMHENVRLIEGRRLDDATRSELPVRRPDDLSEDFSGWFGWHLRQTTTTEVSPHFLATNNEVITLENVQGLASHVAALAHTVGAQLASK